MSKGVDKKAKGCTGLAPVPVNVDSPAPAAPGAAGKKLWLLERVLVREQNRNGYVQHLTIRRAAADLGIPSEEAEKFAEELERTGKISILKGPSNGVWSEW